MCNDIGEASYVDSLVAAAFLSTVLQLPGGRQIGKRISERYKLDLGGELQGGLEGGVLGCRLVVGWAWGPS